MKKDQNFDLIIQGGSCVTPAGIEKLDVGIINGRIAALGSLGAATTKERMDATDLHVLPGIIDSQVHFREPGLEHKEDLSTGTVSAALGGVTTIFEMPNTKPSTTTAEAMADKVRRGREKAWVDFAFFAGAAAENVNNLAELERVEGCSGVKIFMGSSTGSLLVDDPEVLEGVLRNGTRRVAVHCEDKARLRQRRPMVDVAGVTAHKHPEWRDARTGILATQNLLNTARKVGRRVHVLHVTTAEEMEILADYKDIATVEVTPQHLTLVAPDCYDRLGTYAQMNPPIREAVHRDALWQALRDGIVDVIGSDHAPHTRDEKDKPYPASPSGMPGVQTMLPLMLDHVNAGRLSLLRLVDLLCHGPARIYGIANKGRLVLGYDADITMVNLNTFGAISHEQMASRCGWTPFHGRTIAGWPVATIVRGNIVMRDGNLMGEALGEPVRFTETLTPSEGGGVSRGR